MLTDEIMASYFRTGLARVRAVLGEADLSTLRREWARLWKEIPDSHPSVQWRNHAHGITADRLDPAYILSPQLQSLCGDSRLTSIARAALGGDAVFFKDKLITKSSGTHGYALHQDWPYWARFGVPADCVVTLQIAIDRSDEENGALEVWPKAAEVLPSPPDEPLDVDPTSVDERDAQLIVLEPGDVFLLHPLAPHRSGTNRSSVQRRAYFVTYVRSDYLNAARQRAMEVQHDLAS
jgi:ectoine hydroxylase-related dioxygenase (phytanoyl-CoA dioxygenase family)